MGARLVPRPESKIKSGGSHARRHLCRSRQCARCVQAPSLRWYRDVHLLDAIRSFGARKAWPLWSLSDPAVHQAMYQDAAALERAVGGDEMKRLIADFNRDWPDVTRARESFALAETFLV